MFRKYGSLVWMLVGWCDGPVEGAGIVACLKVNKRVTPETERKGHFLKSSKNSGLGCPKMINYIELKSDVQWTSEWCFAQFSCFFSCRRFAALRWLCGSRPVSGVLIPKSWPRHRCHPCGVFIVFNVRTADYPWRGWFDQDGSENACDAWQEWWTRRQF